MKGNRIKENKTKLIFFVLWEKIEENLYKISYSHNIQNYIRYQLFGHLKFIAFFLYRMRLYIELNDFILKAKI